MAAFSDFCVACVEEKALEDIFQTAIRLGYDWIAVNTPLTMAVKSKKKKQTSTEAKPTLIKISDESSQILKLEGRRLRQISRVTALLEDNSNAHKLSSPEVQAYELVAVQPTNDQTFRLACSTLEVDIISINMTEKIPFFLGRNLVNLAIERGIHFEILYGPALRDSSFRQNTISNAHQLADLSKGKNIIFSSGCEKALELRGPYDVANLGLLFGLSPTQSKDAVSKACRAVMKHSEARRISKSVVGVIRSSELPSRDKWLLRTCEISDDCDVPLKKKKKRGRTH